MRNKLLTERIQTSPGWIGNRKDYSTPSMTSVDLTSTVAA